MPRYKVHLTTGDVTMSGTVVVDAKDKSAAEEMAIEKAREGHIKWEVNDGNTIDDIYICDDSEDSDCIEEVDDDYELGEDEESE